MTRNHEAGLPSQSGAWSGDTVAVALQENGARENDATLLALETRFNALVAELDHVVQRHRGEALTKEAEATLAHLDPVERAIMETPACTIAGLGVKARHAAYVLSEYWETPIDRIDWDARAIRLLIEAICDIARTPLPLGSLRDGG
ncbi:conserved hypothetical protein [Bradyrhizobium sp. STM 3843]|uniref:hypothetical protein n=1 Tax=Bradyrhizobium sp. STM 3843 TaxID=551947 RepID=UPI00024038A9|nr:hypothetical protein [Bradyrhizobium sp. STM 3843]CCE12102.1 conserved hypothetical protein [Bradyrhizobium sp. STM 3843]